MNANGNLCKTYSATCLGMEGVCITVEVSISSGVGIFIVGLPDNAVRESLLRVTTAMQRNGFTIPGRKIVVNMAPADIRKEGSGYDASIAVAMLAASEQITFPEPEKYLIMGELSLDGRIKKVRGLLPIALKAASMGFTRIICPAESAAEACWAEGVTVYAVSDLQELILAISGDERARAFELRRKEVDFRSVPKGYDFSEVAGQQFARRGMEIAACGSHNVLLFGPPGSGKSMMSKCLASILPPMDMQEAIETSIIYSVAGLLDVETGLVTHRPYRAPHHSASLAAMVGGGSRATPGEISLSHNGVLCMDEVSLFSASVLDSLRQPMEERKITLSRVKYRTTFPASFMLVASMNPCPCGYAGTGDGRCTCSPSVIYRYRSRLSGPFMDRIDLNIGVKAVESCNMSINPEEESSAKIAERVIRAREVQKERFRGDDIHTNAQMQPEHLRKYCVLEDQAEKMLRNFMDSYALSARGYVRVLKVARTIADMDRAEKIGPAHISEAVQYRFPENL